MYRWLALRVLIPETSYDTLIVLGRAKDKIMVETNLKYPDDSQMLLDIVSAMPKRVDSTLAAYRNKLLGNIPKHRNDFQPESLPSKMEGGDKILEMDSSRNLPNNWQDLDMKKEFGIRESPIEVSEVNIQVFL